MTGGRRRGDKAEREQLRRDMAGRGCPVEMIAAEMRTQFGARPRTAWRHAHGWSQEQAATEYNRVTGKATMTAQRISDYETWPHGGRRPSPTTLAGLALAYQTTPRQLCDHADLAAMPADEQHMIVATPHSGTAGAAPAPSPAGSGRRAQAAFHLPLAPVVRWAASLEEVTPTPLFGPPTPGPARGPLRAAELEEAVIMAASNESMDHASNTEITNVSAERLEQLHADVARIARAYVTGSPVVLYTEMYRLREIVYHLLDGHQYPAQTGELTLLAGQLTGLMGHASLDFGYRDAAIQQARAAFMYGNVIDHNGLRAWARAELATGLIWSGSPHQAVRAAVHGLQFAPSAAAACRLRCLEAVARASYGDTEGTRDALTHARRARDEDHRVDEMHDVTGGQWSFPLSRQEYLAASAYTRMGDHQQAITAAHAAIDHFTASPTEERSFGCEALARVDLATSYLGTGDLDGARDALAAVLMLPQPQRLDVIAERLTSLRTLLAGRYPAAAPARELSEHIEDFAGSTAARALPGPHTN